MKTELFTPWSLSDNGERVIDCDGDEVCDLNDGDFASPRIIEAAARLIAAAPDLLEALQNLENDDGIIPDHAWKMVQDAINKATQP